ncbi:MAG TPA: patatin-like phospholipase family protein [Acidiferrobacterales bacterium]|nr:patatin-like phospholipase family protein [Acidiferrobacterales bacterium]
MSMNHTVQKPNEDPPGLVLALGGGGARGLAHIGVLQVLEENHIPVRAVVGTSIGAQIGAFFASRVSVGRLVELSVEMDWKQTLQLFIPDMPGGGLCSGKRIMRFLNTNLGNYAIEELETPYIAVATDLQTGEQIILDKGSLTEAIRASISLPGLLAPHRLNNRLLVDGAIVNPLPFDIARQRFGGPVLAVATHPGARILNKQEITESHSIVWLTRLRELLKQPWVKRAEPMRLWLEEQIDSYKKKDNGLKNSWRTHLILNQVMNITQAQLVRLRAAVDPPDLMLTPDVHRIGPLEFYRGREAVQAGRLEAKEKLPQIKRLINSED